MSTAEPLDNCSLPESSQQSSGALNFILSKLGRPSRNGSKGGPAMSGMGNSGLEGSPASKQGGDGLGKALPSREQDLDDEEVQSLPKPAVVPSNFNFAGRRGRHGTAAVVPQAAIEGAGPSESETFLAAIPVGNRSASDTSQWNFRRREARRNSRSAREWVRESCVEAPASDWSKGLTKYDPEDNSPPPAAAPGDMHLVPTHFEGGGMRFRRRSRSTKDLAAATRESVGAGDHQTRLRASLEAPGSPHGSKRSSFEAGLSQNLKATASPRVSAEKVRRQGNGGSTSDFLPTELMQRSRLFNTRSSQPRE